MTKLADGRVLSDRMWALLAGTDWPPATWLITIELRTGRQSQRVTHLMCGVDEAAVIAMRADLVEACRKWEPRWLLGNVWTHPPTSDERL